MNNFSYQSQLELRLVNNRGQSLIRKRSRVIKLGNLQNDQTILHRMMYLKKKAMDKSPMQKIARVGLGAFLVVAGIGHLSFARKEFQAQVPDWVPIAKDDTVVYSGIAEIALGAALIFAPAKQRSKVGKIAAAFFTAVFPGNIAQYKDHRDGFGLDTDGKRLARLFFQPILVSWALKSTCKS